MVLVIAAVVALALGMFAGSFQETVTVRVDAPRSGLVLDPDAKVRIRGVEIGHVSEVSYADDRALLRLAIDPEQLELVPENATVDIRSTTIFGAKYVNFVAPPDASLTPMRPGTTVHAQSVTVEINTVFEQLAAVLAQIDPAKLNATLEALGTALDGRGAKLGDLLTRADAYLRELNPSLPALQRDVTAAAQVTALYSATAGDLLRTLDNAAATSTTIATSQGDLDALLLSVTGLANSGRAVLGASERDLVDALALLRPTSELLLEYAPTLNCVINGLGSLMPLAELLFGGGPDPWLAFNTNFMLAGESYKYPEDLPKVNATGGPRCDGVIDRVPGSHADYLVTDTNVGAPYVPPTKVDLNQPRVFEILFGGLPGVTSQF
ncbi:MCE family protein [Nocardia bovistercoris]|uniref:MCE family protein n=1 Tax=Nocardia bovistercoris TaxID=2785916 RepID=A0A931N150_9NOCA|nr:MCE family protein [Nocardia bovistercoris]MBH0775327.1 MCE family protein [Nocardia bovistercoris]